MIPRFLRLNYWNDIPRWQMRINYVSRVTRYYYARIVACCKEGPSGVLQVLRSLSRRVFHRIFNILIGLANSLLFRLFKLFGKIKLGEKRKLESVLHLSLISHKPYMLSRIMRDNGVHSSFLALNCDGSYLDIGYDWGIPTKVNPIRRKWLEFYYTWTVLAKFDVIHCHFNTMVSHMGTELDLMKKLGKLVVFHYRGCDARYRSLNMQNHPKLNCCAECNYPVGSCDTPSQHQRLALTHKYGDVFFVTTPDLLEFAPASATHIPFLKPNIPLSEIKTLDRDETVFRVVTSSNHHGIDGTPYVERAVSRLQEEGFKIELIIVEKMPYLEALAWYKSADVFAGKLRMGYYNNANIETLMLGVPNLSYVRPDFQDLVPDSPIINTTIHTIYDNLLHALNHREDLKEIGARGPAFVEKYHSHDKVAATLIEQYQRGIENLNRKSHEPVQPNT